MQETDNNLNTQWLFTSLPSYAKANDRVDFQFFRASLATGLWVIGPPSILIIYFLTIFDAQAKRPKWAGFGVPQLS